MLVSNNGLKEGVEVIIVGVVQLLESLESFIEVGWQERWIVVPQGTIIEAKLVLLVKGKACYLLHEN